MTEEAKSQVTVMQSLRLQKIESGVVRMIGHTDDESQAPVRIRVKM